MRKLNERFELAFRTGVVHPFLRRVFRNPPSAVPIDLQSVKRLLVFRYDRIGDMIITIPILEALKRRHPALRLAVLASESNAELLQECSSVDELYVLEKNWFKLLKQVLDLRRQRFDVLLNFIFNRTTTPGILANIVAPKGYKVGQGPDRYAFYFNRLLKLPRYERHMIECLAVFVEEVFGLQLTDDELRLNIRVNDDWRQLVDNFLTRHLLQRRSTQQGSCLPYIILNLSCKDPARRMSFEQAAGLARHLSHDERLRMVLLCAPEDKETRRLVLNDDFLSKCPLFRTEGSTPLLQIASLVEGALLVVTCDTSLVHFASAMHTPVLGLYTHLQGLKEWLPYRIHNAIVEALPGMSVSSIRPAVLIEKTDEFITTVLQNETHPIPGVT